MQICIRHWEQMRASIEQAGLSGLVSQDGAEAVERAGGQTPADFDPLMSMHNFFVAARLSAGGLDLLMTDEAGNHRCPLCEVDQQGGNAGEWITSTASEMRQYAVREGLVSLQ